ncbi:hypothetical protein [Frondihabitans australicus]|uniref:hypothetical protein n=1 Tax=Frondihabitans australicus TaxID=386892 RepID=UPI000EB317EA|nr:hypothetical protein [Frondihabitans australicus]
MFGFAPDDPSGPTWLEFVSGILGTLVFGYGITEMSDDLREGAVFIGLGLVGWATFGVTAAQRRAREQRVVDDRDPVGRDTSSALDGDSGHRATQEPTEAAEIDADFYRDAYDPMAQVIGPGKAAFMGVVCCAIAVALFWFGPVIGIGRDSDFRGTFVAGVFGIVLLGYAAIAVLQGRLLQRGQHAETAEGHDDGRGDE